MRINHLAVAIMSSMITVQKTKIDLGNCDGIKHNPRNNRKTKRKK